jgi:fermentation-respiration switch protein FrsA (DUF1100 family)
MVWLGIALGIVAAALFITYQGATWIMYDPHRKPLIVDPSQFQLGFETVEFQNNAGQLLKAWIVPAKTASAPRRTVFLCHGWGTNKGFIFKDTHFMAEKFDLFYIDFRGCGAANTTKVKGSIGYMESFDADAAFDFLRERRPALLERLGIWGRSMGGAVALVQASKQPEIRSAVIEASFASYNEVITRWNAHKTFVPDFPLIPMTRWWIRTRIGADPESLAPIRHVDKLGDKPVFYIQGDADWLMPVSEAEKLYSLTKGPKELWIIKGADHDQCWEMDPKEYERRVLEFFDRTL